MMASAADLRAFGTRVLETFGVPTPDAELVADSLVVAEEWGHPSHGMLRLPWYVERLRTGRIEAVTRMEVLNDTGALVSVDGHSGVGQVVAARAMDLAVERAKVHGVGVVGVRNSNHFGTAAYFTRRAAAAGCAAILTTNGSPAMAPWGGMDKAVGANPWSFATPDGQGDAAVLDIANTGVARGKIYAAAEKGEPMPEGWALDSSGHPTTDPAAALGGGVVLPMGGHKGYAISFMMDVFSGVLTGSSFGTDVGGPWQPDAHSGAGHLAIAIDIAAFQPLAAFDERMSQLIGQVKGVRPAPGAGDILYPGELENRNAASGRGIPLPAKTRRDLAALGAARGIPFPPTGSYDLAD
ncbi:Ldh family oxidoreductase [Microbacterium elymi]|uniref:Ldh family oxidoreductase n=1 Tax=Microbacterium elymi TaxID=2909587 RepID=A0ABY5NHJ0_9MICO|nr:MULTISPECIES: Ldh family oxidoreductase [Microbacterium]UUT34574.1 Ldh family oxidoreductase [Microbacterium elymi]